MIGYCLIGEPSNFQVPEQDFKSFSNGLADLIAKVELTQADGQVKCVGSADVILPLYDKINGRYLQHHRTARRKARLAAVGGKHSQQDLKRIWNLQEGRCYYSGVALGPSFEEAKFHVDHIIPVIQGGTNWASNLALVTGKMNQLKKGFDRQELLAHLYPKAERKVIYKRIHRIDRQRRKLFPQPEYCEGELDDDLFGLCDSFGWKPLKPRSD